MNENRMVDATSPAPGGRDTRAWSVALGIALGVGAGVPFGVACGGSSNPPPAAPTATANVAMGQPPPGYPGYPQAQPGYPQQQPQAGYPPAQTAYPPQAGYPQPQGYPPQGQPQPAPPGPQPAPAASQSPGPLAPTDPNSLQGILQGLQGALQGTMVAPGSIPGDLTEAGLKAQALRLAPGMQPDGAELKQAMTEGQHAVAMVTLQAGKCYTIVGFSPLGGVKDLDINLLAPPFYMTLAGQDLTHNNMPVIGAAPSPMCPVIAFPLQYKLDVLARAGSGQVAVQLYSKNK